MLKVKTNRKLRKENFWMMLKRSRNFMINLYHKNRQDKRLSFIFTIINKKSQGDGPPGKNGGKESIKLPFVSQCYHPHMIFVAGAEIVSQ